MNMQTLLLFLLSEFVKKQETRKYMAPVKGSNEIEFTVSFRCEDDLNTATDKIDTEYKSF